MRGYGKHCSFAFRGSGARIMLADMFLGKTRVEESPVAAQETAPLNSVQIEFLFVLFRLRCPFRLQPGVHCPSLAEKRQLSRILCWTKKNLFLLEMIAYECQTGSRQRHLHKH